jgi:hypothetical protein
MRLKPIKHALLCIAIVIAGISGCALEKEKMPDLICSLGPIDPNQAQIQMTITNQSTFDVKLLSWHTPFEGFLSHMFDVEYQGALLAYQGPMVKRNAPTENDYFVLRSGTARTASVNLGLIYDMSQPGTYQIRYRKQLSAQFTKPIPANSDQTALPTIGLCDDFQLSIKQ